MNFLDKISNLYGKIFGPSERKQCFHCLRWIEPDNSDYWDNKFTEYVCWCRYCIVRNRQWYRARRDTPKVIQPGFYCSVQKSNKKLFKFTAIGYDDVVVINFNDPKELTIKTIKKEEIESTIILKTKQPKLKESSKELYLWVKRIINLT